MRSRIGRAVLGAVAAVAVAAVGAGASYANGGPGGKLHPVDGAHWQAQMGLPDSSGNANQALIGDVSSVGEYPFATFTGLDGAPLSTLGTLGFTAHTTLPGGINPCWDIDYTDPSGNQRSISLDTNNTDRVRRIDLGNGWTQFSFPGSLPQGTIDSITVGLDVTMPLPDTGPVTVALDNIVLGGHTWTFAGDNAVDGSV